MGLGRTTAMVLLPGLLLAYTCRYRIYMLEALSLSRLSPSERLELKP